MQLDRAEQDKLLTEATQALVNVMEEELQAIQMRLVGLRTTLNLSARDPDVLASAVETVSQAYMKAHSTVPAFSHIDAESFAEQWSRDLSPARLALRDDLELSSRSFGEAIGLSDEWLLRHGRPARRLRSKFRRLISLSARKRRPPRLGEAKSR